MRPFQHHCHISRPPSASRERLTVPVTSSRVRLSQQVPEIYNVSTPKVNTTLVPRAESPSFFHSAKASLTPEDLIPSLSKRERRRPTDLASISSRESSEEEAITTHRNYLTWTQIPPSQRIPNKRTASFIGSRSSLRRATPSHFMIGDPLIHMNEPDPTSRQVKEFSR